MPSYSVNAIIKRPGRKRTIGTHNQKVVAVHEFWEDPISWSDLKDTLLTAAQYIFFNYDEQTVTMIFIQKHLSGKYRRITVPGTYRKGRIRIGVQNVFSARLTYSSFVRPVGEVKVDRATFLDPEWYYRYAEEYNESIGKKWKMKPAIDPGFEAMLHSNDIDSLFRDLLTLKYSSYEATPKNSYAPMQEQRHTGGMYAGIPKNLYAPRRQQTYLNDEQEEETEHDEE